MGLSRRFRHRRDDWTVPRQLQPMTTESVDTPLICAVCAQPMLEPAARVLAIVVCPDCGGSSVVEADGTTRRTMGADTTALTAAELQTLRTARGRFARPGRRQR